MKKEEEFVLAANKKLNIWVDLYKTKVTERVMLEIVRHLIRMNGCIHKLTIFRLGDLSII